MSARGMLSMVGTVVGGIVGLGSPPPPDPDCVRELLAEIGMPAGDTDDDLTETVRTFQDRVGLRTDGVAGPRTVHILSRIVMDRRSYRFDLAA